jgi:formamidopyrimidine-DNA glycosylase
MPELPDLQVFSRNLNEKLAGKTIKNITILKLPKLNVSEQELKEKLEGAELERVYREGKELRLQFNNGQRLGIHLMLNGKLHLFDRNNIQKNTLLELLFTDNAGLALTDFQGFANATLNPEEREAPDALSIGLNEGYLENKLKTSRSNIKSLLLDQNFIRGIGNAYADEILWVARISPFSIGNKIPKEKVKTLAASIVSVLIDAEKKINESHPGIIRGEIRDFLKVHNSKKSASPTGATIQVDNLNSRKTYFTEEQELFK